MRLAFPNIFVAFAFGLALPLGGTPVSARGNGPLGDTALVLGTGKAGLKVRSGPGLEYQVLDVLSEGTRVRVVSGPSSDGDRSWYQIRSPDGATARMRGWVAGTYLVAPERVVQQEDGSVGTRTLEAKVLGYTSGGTIGTVTATGTRVRWGTVAVDPRFIPLGSLLLVDGLEGIFTAEDTGPAIKGAMIDVWFPDRTAALSWGTRMRTVRVLREGY